MCRTVADAAILLSALAGPDPADAATRSAGEKGAADYTRFLDPNGLKGARIGVPRKGLFGQSPAADRLVEAAIAEMKRLGAVIVDPADIETVDGFSGSDTSELAVLLYELKADLNAYLASLPSPRVRTLADVIDFNQKNKDREMPYFGQELFIQAQEKGPLTDRAYLKALKTDLRLARREGIDKAMDASRLDAIVGPTGGPAWLTDLVNGDHLTGISSSTFPAIAGYPAISLPAGFVFGLPVGLTFFGRAWSEPVLLKLAYAFEQATHHRRPPRFLPTVELTRAT
jgi:amidase